MVLSLNENIANRLNHQKVTKRSEKQKIADLLWEIENTELKKQGVGWFSRHLLKPIGKTLKSIGSDLKDFKNILWHPARDQLRIIVEKIKKSLGKLQADPPKRKLERQTAFKNPDLSQEIEQGS